MNTDRDPTARNPFVRELVIALPVLALAGILLVSGGPDTPATVDASVANTAETATMTGEVLSEMHARIPATNVESEPAPTF